MHLSSKVYLVTAMAATTAGAAAVAVTTDAVAAHHVNICTVP